MNRYANYPRELKNESIAFIKTLNVGDKLWPKSHHEELTVAAITASQTGIYFEESMWEMTYPLKSSFHSKTAVWWRKNILPRLKWMEK